MIAFTLRHDDDIKYSAKNNFVYFFSLRSLAPARRLDFLRLFGEIEHSTDATAYALIFLVISAAQYLVIGRGEVTLLLLQNDSPGLQTLQRKPLAFSPPILKYSVRLRRQRLSRDRINRNRKW